jgi:alginate O-acetyltransferase complex protein AlgI
MLFNSYIFLLLFLPCTMLGFFLIGGRGQKEAAIGWLVCASLFFYAWWKPAYLAIIVLSMMFNFGIGAAIREREGRRRKALLIVGMSANLALLGYYKYAHFFIQNLNQLVGAEWSVQTILLPLAISFFTFQQIAYLVDCYRNQCGEYSFLHYSLFVTFFPQLIAGPIVHHREMMPQFAGKNVFRVDFEHLSVGFTLFAFGLFKKVVLADSLANYATPVFIAAEAGVAISALEAWGGALAYTFQLYFDFSGYSDMAIGLARLFGIRLPQNFNSPYKARNIIEFWRRWHITLSRFLRDHIYIPLGGNRTGESRRYVNMFATMLLGGLWHGAGWTFVIWGALHGLYLTINHGWQQWRKRRPRARPASAFMRDWLPRIVTFLAVVLAWVLFRAESFSGAMVVISSMLGSNGLHLSEFSINNLAEWDDGFLLIGIAALIAWFLPNTQQIMRRHRPIIEEPDAVNERGLNRFFGHSFTYGWCLITAAVFAYATIRISKGGEFLYFNF